MKADMKYILFFSILLLITSCMKEVDLEYLRPAGPSARFSAPGAECFRFAGYGCYGFLVQKLVCLGHGYGRRGRGWQHTSVYKRPFARTYAARFR